MPNHTYQTVVVTGINSGDASSQIVDAHAYAKTLFDEDLVSELSPIGHNYVQSFCIFPSGSGNERAPQQAHRASIKQFCDWMSSLSTIDYVAVRWTSGADPKIIRSHSEW